MLHPLAGWVIGHSSLRRPENQGVITLFELNSVILEKAFNSFVCIISCAAAAILVMAFKVAIKISHIAHTFLWVKKCPHSGGLTDNNEVSLVWGQYQAHSKMSFVLCY